LSRARARRAAPRSSTAAAWSSAASGRCRATWLEW